MSTEGAASPGETTLTFSWTSNPKVSCSPADPGAEVMKWAVYFPAVGKVACPTYTPFTPSTAHTKVIGDAAIDSPLGPWYAIERVRSGLAICFWPPGSVRVNTTRLSPTRNALVIGIGRNEAAEPRGAADEEDGDDEGVDAGPEPQAAKTTDTTAKPAARRRRGFIALA